MYPGVRKARNLPYYIVLVYAAAAVSVQGKPKDSLMFCWNKRFHSFCRHYELAKMADTQQTCKLP